MLSLIEVTCPHCAAQGQIMVPPPGAIIIGPCPECQGMVAVFCGRVLALDKAVMTEGTAQEKRNHVNAVLGNFLRDRVDRLFSDSGQSDGQSSAPLETPARDPEPPVSPHEQKTPPVTHRNGSVITSEELESFRAIDLRLLDNSAYFKAIFNRD